MKISEILFKNFALKFSILYVSNDCDIWIVGSLCKEHDE